MSNSRQSARDEETFGMLVRTLPVRLLGVSRAGCLVEIGRPLDVGSNGQLRLEVDGTVHVDDVRVCRCRMCEGGNRVHHAGMELLGTRRLSRRSLRLAMRRMIAEHGGTEILPTEKSGR